MNKNFQEIKLFISHCSFTTLAPNTIVRLQSETFWNTSDGLFPIFELKLKCCFCTSSIGLLFIYFVITDHWRILQCAVVFSLLVPWIQLKPLGWSLFSVVCLRLYILAEKVSLNMEELSSILTTDSSTFDFPSPSLYYKRL